MALLKTSNDVRDVQSSAVDSDLFLAAKQSWERQMLEEGGWSTEDRAY